VREAGIAGPSPGYEQHIRPDFYLGGAHNFPEATLEPVSSDCISDPFTCQEGKPAGIQAVGVDAQHQQLICYTAAVLANIGKVLLTRKPLRSLHLAPVVV
jgi:hypothetical protein